MQAQEVPDNCNFLNKIGGIASVNGAEISTYDPVSKRVYTVAGPVIEYYTLSNKGSLALKGSLPLGFSPPSGSNALPNSVAYKNGVVAASYAVVNATTNAQQPGRVTLYEATTGKILKSVEVGYLPDMVTFTADGKKLLSANEGEPNGYNQPSSFDPEGSVSIVDLSAGVTNATVQTASFTAFNSQADALKAAGVRIYGPNATVAQDIEPEYIAISPDGKQAVVTLQENNALAIVDIASATVLKIIPLGLKDHNKVSVFGVETFDFNNLSSIGSTTADQSIPLGGFSGLAFEGYAANGNLKFITHTDRGPNGEPTGIYRPFFLPKFAPEIIRFEVDRYNGRIIITQRIQLKVSAGQLLTGVSNISLGANASQAYNDEVPVDLLNDVLPLDPLGADLEGIYVAADGSFWMVDEYRPAIYHFDSNGVLIKRYVPIGTAAAAGKPAGTFGVEALPAVLAQRRQNRGFEAVAFQNGKLYAFVQSPLRNPASLSNTVLNGLQNIRIVEFDPATETTTAQYIYRMDNPAAVSATDTRADKIGDAVALGNGEILVVERDDDAIDSDPVSNIQKKIYRFSLVGATPINAANDILYSGKSLDQMTPAELTAAGINLIAKTLHVDLALTAYNNVEKVEGLAIIDRNTLALINDNDFTVAGTSIDTIAGTFSPYPNSGAEKPLLGLINLQYNGLDASDRDLTSSTGKINIQNWPVHGMYQPDAIAQYTINGETYYITANEGDARDWPGFSEEIRVGAAGYVLDPVAFPNAVTLKSNANLGRLQLTNASGDTDGDGDFDRIQALGARSFSIWNAEGKQVFDSGDELEQITAAQTPTFFNSDGTAASFDTRSDNKGPEPEAVVIASIVDVPYAFIGLERTGDIVVYDVSNPKRPVFLQYINAPEDLGVEGLIFVPAWESPTGKPLLIASAEVSKTLAIFEINVPGIQVTENSGTPNDGIICEGASAVLTATGSPSYKWTTGETGSSITVTPGSTTQYGARGCNNLKGFKILTVIPSAPCSITAIPSSQTFTGGIATNLYLGYGPQQLTLKTNTPETGAPYTYKWSGGKLSNYNTAHPVFTATEQGSFTFTAEITNKNGCVSTCSITICVTDIRVPKTYGQFVYACVAHDGRTGYSKTVPVSVYSIPFLYKVKSIVKLGKCNESPCELITKGYKMPEEEEGNRQLGIKAFPNPSNNHFTLQLQSGKSEPIEIKVMDIQGRVLLTKRSAGFTSFSFGQNFVSGTYIVEVTQGDRRETFKMIKQ